MVTFEPVRAFRLPRAWWRPETKTETPDLLMTLPPELRNRIYELSFEDESVTIARNDKEPALLQVSKTIGTEATRLYYGSRRYYFLLSTGCVSPDEPWILTTTCEPRRLGRLVQLCGKSPFLSFEFLSLCENCVDLDDLLALLEVMRTTGLEPDKSYAPGNGSRRQEKARSMESATSMIHTHSRAHQRASRTVARAIAMGRRARDGKWSKLKLEKRFAEFLDLAEAKRRKRKWPAYL